MSAVDFDGVLRRMAERREQNVADTVCRSGPDQAWVARMQEEAAALRCAIAALDALAASERDAARYRWLKAEGIVRVHPMVTRAGSRIFADGSNVPGNFTYVIDGKVSDLDTAIDTAMPQGARP